MYAAVLRFVPRLAPLAAAYLALGWAGIIGRLVGVLP